MLSRLEENSESITKARKIFNVFDFETKADGVQETQTSRLFFELLPGVFPNATRIKHKTAYQTVTKYKGIRIKPPLLDTYTTIGSIADIKHHIPSEFQLQNESESSVTFTYLTGYYMDDNAITKTITFNKTGSWVLIIDGKDINLNSAHVSDKFHLSVESINVVCEIVKILELCLGVNIRSSVIVTRFHQYSRLRDLKGIQSRIVRSILCEKIFNKNSVKKKCIKCRKMILKYPDKENVMSSVEKQQPTSKQPTSVENQNPSSNQTTTTTNKPPMTSQYIKTLIPDITDDVAEFFAAQALNASRDPRGRRWPQKVISTVTTCLQWYNKSPQSYEGFRASNMLVLPCPSTLILYKNKLKQEPGFENQTFEWMCAEAESRGIDGEGLIGGIVIDEMSIQADLQITRNGDAIELCGFTDMGREGNSCTALRTGKQEKCLGTYALQFVFLCITGFRFPFAHFITNGAQATELYPLFWEAVNHLFMFGFTVLYASLDGAQSNRNFMKYNLGGEICRPYTTLNPYSFGEIAFIMDVSHVIKKIRNGILSSGIGQHHTRLLTLPTNYTIQWQMFKDCFWWDKNNSLQLHRKLTNEHLNLSCHSKMRNFLAEDILNGEMLHCMSQYQLYLGERGDILQGAIQMLQQTSKLIDIFRDMRPVMHKDDERLQELEEIGAWFEQCLTNLCP